MNCNLIKVLLLLVILYAPSNNANAQIDIVHFQEEITNSRGGFLGVLDNFDFFGSSITNIGDLDGDQVEDIAIGAYGDDDGFATNFGNPGSGAVWILFLNANGTVKSHQKISKTNGNFTGLIDENDSFGCSVTGLGDLDGDGVNDLAVGAYSDDDGSTLSGSLPSSGRGAVWILFLNANGTVKSHQKISEMHGNFNRQLNDYDSFGRSVSKIDDLNGDGIQDVVVGAPNDSDNGIASGAVYVLFLNTNGTVKSSQKITSGKVGFNGDVFRAQFGWSVSNIGDINKDGSPDIAIGARTDRSLKENAGAVWILFLNTNGFVKSYQKISENEGDFDGVLDAYDQFGWSVTSVPDFNNDSKNDIAVTAIYDDDAPGSVGTDGLGAVWLLALNENGRVVDEIKITDSLNGFTSNTTKISYFGEGLSFLNDINGDRSPELIIGSPYARLSPTSIPGSVWVLFLNPLTATSNTPPTLTPIGNQTTTEGTSLEFTLGATDADNDTLAYSATNLPDGAIFDLQTQTFSWTPGYSDSGTYDVTFTVTDDGEPVASDTETITITVENANRTPVLTPIGNKTVNEGAQLQFVVSASDLDNDTLTYTASNLPQGATFNQSTQTFSWTPGYSDEGNYTDIEFAVMDNGTPMELAVELITITVGNVNRAPTLTNPGPQEVLEAAPLALSISASDPDGDSTTITATNLPSGATFNGTAFAWTPSRTQAGIYTVTFTAIDSGTPMESATLDVVITVGDNPTPVEQAEYLVDTVVAYNLPKNVENAYLANLQKVSEFITDGRVQAARNQLNAFIGKVQQDYQKGKLTVSQYTTLMNLANTLLGGL